MVAKKLLELLCSQQAKFANYIIKKLFASTVVGFDSATPGFEVKRSNHLAKDSLEQLTENVYK